MPIVSDTTTTTEPGTLYASVAEARAAGIKTTQASDAELTTWLEEASRVVDNYTHTRFNVTAATAHTVHNPQSALVILPYPFSAVTAVTVDGVAQTLTTNYTVEDFGIRFGYRPRGPVVVTGIFGYPDVPSPVRLATIYIADSLISQSQYRPAIGTDTEGNASGLPTAAFVPRFASNGVDSTGTVRADRLLAPYRVIEGVA